MDFVTLGRTGLRASVMGLGCGGHSRLGTSYGKSEAEAENLVRQALDLGINFIDTAEGYRTEAIVGRAIQGVPRTEVILSTKAGVNWEDRRCTPEEMRLRVEACLSRLETDYIDVFHVHGVLLEEYEYVRQELAPVLLTLKAEGKIRFLGITEAFARDPSHVMLAKAVHDVWWDVIMVGFSILNQSARRRILPLTQEFKIGTLCMFAVRRALSQREALKELIQQLLDRKLIPDVDPDLALDFLIAKGVADSIPDAAYRFCRYEPGMDVVLVGTGNADHLRSNAESLCRPPLPSEIVDRLRRMFEGIDSISGN